MAAVELNRDGPVAWREARPDGEPTGDAVVCLHGFPESSHMWSGLLEALADTGRPALAPDLYALGDSAQFGPATFENSLARFAEWIEQRQLGRVAIVVHDWGGFVGLAWACDHPDRVAALVISDAGFFADGKWHGMADAMRSDQGEALVGGLERDGFGAMLNAGGQVFDDAAIDAYWAPFADNGRGQRATLEFYRSMDFEKLKPWQGKLAELGAPDPAAVGRRGPVRPARRRTPVRARDPGRPPGRDRRRRALRHRRAARALHRRDHRLSHLAGGPTTAPVEQVPQTAVNVAERERTLEQLDVADREGTEVPGCRRPSPS